MSCVLGKSFHLQFFSSVAKQFDAKPLNFQVLEHKFNQERATLSRLRKKARRRAQQDHSQQILMQATQHLGAAEEADRSFLQSVLCESCPPSVVSSEHHVTACNCYSWWGGNAPTENIIASKPHSCFISENHRGKGLLESYSVERKASVRQAQFHQGEARNT